MNPQNTYSNYFKVIDIKIVIVNRISIKKKKL